MSLILRVSVEEKVFLSDNVFDVVNMSLFKYFALAKDKEKTTCSAAGSIALALSNEEISGVSQEEAILISEELTDIENSNKTAVDSKQTIYKDENKIKIARYASENGTSKAVSRFKNEFPKLNESTVRPWVRKYKAELNSKKPRSCLTIGTKRGRPTIHSAELDQKLRAMIINLRTAGAEITIHVLRGVLAGIIRSNLERFGQFSDFEVTRSFFFLFFSICLDVPHLTNEHRTQDCIAS